MYLLETILMIIFMSFFSYRRLKHLLHYFQQEEYDALRFLKYFKNISLIDKKLSLALIINALALVFVNEAYFIKISAFLILAFALVEPNREKNAKKPLIMTARAKRILSLALIISVIPFAFTFLMMLDLLAYNLALLILSVQIQPICLLLSNLILSPYETRHQNHFKQEALIKLAEIKPKIIGITGSYGKTSTKKIIEHILSSLSPALATPGSINTLMGICRIIRENLTKAHQYFIVEMGAYQIGSIKKLCDLTPPNFAVITAIGQAHYERFKTLEAVAQAKLEIAEAAIKQNGLVILNSLAIAPEFIAQAQKMGNEPIKIIGHDQHSDYIVSQIEQTKTGINLTIAYQKDCWKISAPIYGIHQAQNLATAFALCHSLGINGELIAALLKTVPQIPHRLEVKTLENGLMIIDDAYNSNPEGFNSALDLLRFLGAEKRKILVTPGMTELGKLHETAHRKLGEKAALCADLALIINPQRIKSFTECFEKSKTLEFDRFAEAKKWLDDNAQAHDLILYENDLPDLYETKINL